MPGLSRKLLVFAAVDGLILQSPARNQRRDGGVTGVKIDYKKQSITPVLQADDHERQKNLHKLEAHGIIGLLSVSSSAYLICITRHNQVAHLWGKPVYQITDVELIPISSQRDAQRAITDAIDTAWHLEGITAKELEAFDVDVTGVGRVDDESLGIHVDDVSDLSSLDDRPARAETDHLAARRRSSADTKETGIAEEVIGQKGAYGRFAERWFSQRGWLTGQRRQMGMSSQDDLTRIPSPTLAASDNSTPLNLAAGTDQSLENHQRWPQTTPKLEKSLDEAMGGVSSSDEKLTASLLPKLVQTTKMLFSSGTFYFSYDSDITRALAQQSPKSVELPLYKQVQSEYFWNEHLLQPLIEIGCDELALPVMQGFVGQRAFTVGSNSQIPSDAAEEVVNAPSQIFDAGNEAQELHEVKDSDDKKKFLVTLISRRSKKRAGLRYLRRGIDEDGNTANSVETEQILSPADWDSSDKIHSYLQIRGSIPLFYSQTPYTFKPPPVLHGSKETNQAAFRKHFSSIASKYGNVHAVSLIDRHGVEVKVGEAYEEQMKLLNDRGGVQGKQIGFEWFDFHTVCKGMKFENVSILVSAMLPFLTTSSWTTVTPRETASLGTLSKQQPSFSQSQSGIIRTNCMDCLDRTNVVQSAFGQRILELQLAAAGHTIDLQADPTTQWFNSLWADNGDAVSRAYAGTSALKGDYTRTRKRNALGALNDLTLTLSRYYRNLFDDFFAQAAIDYLLGAVTASVFTEFEATMTSADPAIDLRRARQTAITTAAHVVLEDAAEDLLGGWALTAPAQPTAPRAGPFTEVLLLLSDAALYSVRFDWDAEAVLSFERVPLPRVRRLVWGTYITATHAPAQTSAARNAGLLVAYAVDPQQPPARANTRTLENTMLRDAWSIPGVDPPPPTSNASAPTEGDGRRAWVFKALPRRSSVVRPDKGEPSPPVERDVVAQICAEIARAAEAARRKDGKEMETEAVEVVERDIVSLEEAKRSVGYLEQLGYSLKKFVWG